VEHGLVLNQSSRPSIVLAPNAVLKVMDFRVNVFGGPAAGERAHHGALIFDGGGVLRDTRFGRPAVSLRRLLESVEARRSTEDVFGANRRHRLLAVERRWRCLAEHALRAAGRVIEGLHESAGAHIVLVAVGVRTPGGEAVSLSCRIRRRRSLGFEEPLDHGGQVLLVSCSSKNDATKPVGSIASFVPNQGAHFRHTQKRLSSKGRFSYLEGDFLPTPLIHSILFPAAYCLGHRSV